MRRLLGLVGLLIALGTMGSAVAAMEQRYVIEDANDPGFAKNPAPPPVHVCTHQFETRDKSHEETIRVDSKHIRNLSVTIENRGPGVVKAPYLFGPYGWDFRSLEKLSAQITKGSATVREKVFRIHEWDGLYAMRCEGNIRSGYGGAQEPLLYLNRYGHMMCGEHALVVTSLINTMKGRGAVKARAVAMTIHMTGEVFWDGAWQGFDSSPGVRWFLYDYDNKTPIGWKRLCDDPALWQRLVPVTGWHLWGKPKFRRYLFEGRRAGKNWDLDYNLLPGESVTMHFEMQGRVDRKSFAYEWAHKYLPKDVRTPCDYASATFAWKPDLTGGYKAFAAEECNVVATAGGLVPADPAKPSYVVFGVDKYPWTLVGAKIRAVFRTGGKVYAAAAPRFKERAYGKSLRWVQLDEKKKEGLVNLEGKAAWWVKFEFRGKGSGLRRAEIASEIQMSRWAMPALEHGENHIRFEAADTGKSPVRVTFRYDDRSPFHSYEPASGNYGRHIRFRVGGSLFSTYGKPLFWEKLAREPKGGETVSLEIGHAAGEKAFRKVRTLIDKKRFAWGNYCVFWDGKDDAGRRCKAGEIYYYRVYGGKKTTSACERLYLFPKLWPVPNEQRQSNSRNGR